LFSKYLHRDVVDGVELETFLVLFWSHRAVLALAHASPALTRMS
jgi:hypothetical protein